MSNDNVNSPSAEDNLDAAEGQLQELLAGSTVGLESWRLTMEMLAGWVRVAIEHGWPEPMARALVFEQVRSNLRTNVAAIELQKRP